MRRCALGHHQILRPPRKPDRGSEPIRVCRGLRRAQSVAAGEPNSVLGSCAETLSARRKIPCRAQGSSVRCPAMPFLILGEALVDLICEQAAEGIRDAAAFAPHFGGAAANVAVSAAWAGGRPALGGGAGQDPWGQWLLERL